MRGLEGLYLQTEPHEDRKRLQAQRAELEADRRWQGGADSAAIAILVRGAHTAVPQAELGEPSAAAVLLARLALAVNVLSGECGGRWR